ncbi:MAG: hypothetical protein NUV82_03655 [Candidatus Komeilibacteria bacterium]|nr:hypothetical protein [Candidatus Komeilibacteria bacterium]
MKKLYRYLLMIFFASATMTLLIMGAEIQGSSMSFKWLPDLEMMWPSWLLMAVAVGFLVTFIAEAATTYSEKYHWILPLAGTIFGFLVGISWPAFAYFAVVLAIILGYYTSRYQVFLVFHGSCIIGLVYGLVFVNQLGWVDALTMSGWYSALMHSGMIFILMTKTKSPRAHKA